MYLDQLIETDYKEKTSDR